MLSLSRALHVDPIEVLEQIEIAPAVPVDVTGLDQDQLGQRAKDYFWAGDFRSALATYDAMLERLALDPQQDDVERTRLHARIEINRATALRRCGALKAARAAAERALSLAQGTPAIQADAYTLLAAVHARLDNLQLARDATQRAVQLSERAGPDVQVHAWNQRGAVLYRSGKHEDARLAFLRVQELARRASDRHHEAHAEGNLGMCLLGLGRRKQASRKLVNAVELARRHGVPALEASWLVQLGRVALDDDLPDDAQRYADAALRVAKPLDHLSTVFRAVWLQHLLAIRRDPKFSDRHRLAHLRSLFVRLEDHDFDEVREYKNAVLGSAKGPGAPDRSSS